MHDFVLHDFKNVVLMGHFVYDLRRHLKFDATQKPIINQFQYFG